MHLVIILYSPTLNEQEIFSVEFMRLFKTSHIKSPDYSLILLHDNTLISNVECEKDDFISVKDKNYLPGVENRYFSLNESTLTEFYYPSRCLLVEKDKEAYIASGNQKKLSYHARQILKRFVRSIFHGEGFYSLHAAAIVEQGKAFLFPGKTHSGKSTLLLNMSAVGFVPMNDDIIFLKKQENGIIKVESVPLLIQVRENSGTVLLPEVKDYPSGLTTIDPYTATSCATEAELSCILFPTIVNGTTFIQEITPDIAKKLLFAAFNAHGRIEISKGFAELFYTLISEEMYSLKMGDDWNFLADWMHEDVKKTGKTKMFFTDV